MSESHQDIKIFSGNANLELAQKIADYLSVPLGGAPIRRFADGEIALSISESVRAHRTYVVQSISPPANEHLMELLIMIDALKRASAAEITAVLPYYAYARQDRKAAPREPITAKLVADLLEAAGVTRVISLDLHAAQIQGFFNVPFDHLFAAPIFISDIKRTAAKDGEELVVVSPDAGGVERARAFAKRLSANLAIIDKRRSKPNVAEVMNIIGEVAGKKAIIIDDMIDTAGTLVGAANAVLKAKAQSVSAIATHGIFSPPAVEKIEASGLAEVIVTDSIPTRDLVKNCKKIRVLSCSSLIGEAIKRVHLGSSVSSLFL